MANYFLTNKAVEDLSEIWEYTCEVWSENQAEKYYYMLLDACQDLADGIIAGKPYREISAEILGYQTGRHIIFYRKTKHTAIEVARILHDRMDLKNRIQDY